MQEAISNYHLFVIQLGFTIFIAFIAYLMKRSISQIDQRLSDGDEKFKKICADIGEIRETRALDREYFAKEYVLKGDFIRELRALEYKIEGVANDVKKLLVLSARRDDHAAV